MKTTYLHGASALILSLAACAAVWQPATAAEAQPPAAARSSLDEVVVVARRTEERLQDVPISVTAINAEGLKQASITTGVDLIKVVPSLNVQQSATGQGPSYSIRGIRTGVVTYFNEVPTGSSSIEDQLWDLQSVQALAGPQGTLFGRNSTGGAILFVPQRPTGEFEGYVEGSVGSYNQRNVTAVVNIPVNDMLKLRLGGRIIRHDGYVNNSIGPDFQSQHRDVFRASALFQPTDKLSNYTVIDYSKRDELPILQVSSNITATAGCAPGLGCTIYPVGLINALGREQDALGIRDTKSSFPAYARGKYYGYSNILTYNLLQNLTFKYVAGFRHQDVQDFSTKFSGNAPLEIGSALSRQESWTNEVQLQGGVFDGRLTATVGAFMSRDKTNSPGGGYALFLPLGSQWTQDRAVGSPGGTRSTSKALFAQATLKVTDKLNLTAGIRHTEDESVSRAGRKGPQFTFFGPNVCLLPVGGVGVDLVNCVRTLSGKWDATTYNLSADYRISEGVLVYATSRRGYNGGGFNTAVAVPTPTLKITFEPEFITDYEAGIKADWRIGEVPVRTNLSIFRANYENIQRFQRGFDAANRPFSVTGNGTEARLQGAQLEAVIKPVPELTLSANYGYLSAKYLKGTDTFSKTNKFAQAPEHTLNASATYERPIAPGGSLIGTLSYTYQSEITFTDDQVTGPASFQKAYSTMDARVGWNSVAGKPIDVALFVKNLRDDVYAIDRQDTLSLFGFVGTVYNEPRTYGVELKYSFGG